MSSDDDTLILASAALAQMTPRAGGRSRAYDRLHAALRERRCRAFASEAFGEFGIEIEQDDPIPAEWFSKRQFLERRRDSLDLLRLFRDDVAKIDILPPTDADRLRTVHSQPVWPIAAALAWICTRDAGWVARVAGPLAWNVDVQTQLSLKHIVTGRRCSAIGSLMRHVAEQKCDCDAPQPRNWASCQCVDRALRDLIDDHAFVSNCDVIDTDGNRKPMVEHLARTLRIDRGTVTISMPNGIHEIEVARSMILKKWPPKTVRRPATALAKSQCVRWLEQRFQSEAGSARVAPKQQLQKEALEAIANLTATTFGSAWSEIAERYGRHHPGRPKKPSEFNP